MDSNNTNTRGGYDMRPLPIVQAGPQLGPDGQPLQPTFDPYTGRPLQPRFDPYTGRPL